MTLSVRLPPDEMLALARDCREHGTTKSAVVLRLLREHVLAAPQKTPFAFAEELGVIGMVDEPYPADYVKNHGRYVTQKLRERHAGRHRRGRRSPPAA